MRKTFLNDLPHKYGIGANKNKLVVDWKVSIGHVVKFIYDNIQGEVEIIDYNVKDNKLTLKYVNNIIFKIATYHFSKCKLKELLGLKTINYKYNIGDIITDIKTN